MRYVSLISLLAIIPNAAVAAPAPNTIICSAELETTFSTFPEQIGQRDWSDVRIYKLDDANSKITAYKKDGRPLSLCSSNCELRYGPYMIEWIETAVGPESKVTIHIRIDRISGKYSESYDTYVSGGRFLAMEGAGVCETLPLIERKF